MTFLYVYTYMYTYIHIYILIYICIHGCTYMCTYNTCVCMCICLHVYTYIYIYMQPEILREAQSPARRQLNPTMRFLTRPACSYAKSNSCTRSHDARFQVQHNTRSQRIERDTERERDSERATLWSLCRASTTTVRSMLPQLVADFPKKTHKISQP